MNSLGEFVLFINEQYNLKIVCKVPLCLILIFRKTIGPNFCQRKLCSLILYIVSITTVVLRDRPFLSTISIPDDYDSDMNYDNRRNLTKKISIL